MKILNSRNNKLSLLIVLFAIVTMASCGATVTQNYFNLEKVPFVNWKEGAFYLKVPDDYTLTHITVENRPIIKFPVVKLNLKDPKSDEKKQILFFKIEPGIMEICAKYKGRGSSGCLFENFKKSQLFELKGQSTGYNQWQFSLFIMDPTRFALEETAHSSIE